MAGCDELEGLAWGWCTLTGSYDAAVQTGASTLSAVTDRAAASADYATSTLGAVASQAVSTGGRAVEGAQSVGRNVAKALRPEVTLSPGGVVTVAALGVGALLLADAYFTGGAGARSLGRGLTGSRR